MAAKLVKAKNNPGVYKRGESYVIRYRVNGQPRWETCRTFTEARDLLALRKRQRSCRRLTGGACTLSTRRRNARSASAT